MSAYTPTHAARSTDPATSHQAAQAATSFAGTHCERIHRALELCGPMDPEQLGAMVGLESYSVRKRLKNLETAGQAEPTGQVVPTVHGRSQRVWRAL